MADFGDGTMASADDSSWLQPRPSQQPKDESSHDRENQPQQRQPPQPQKTQKDRIRGSVAVSRKALGERTATSIPTKFETVLEYEKERDGFLTRTLRFVDQGITKNTYGQGPGFYHHELPLLFQKESISKKGYGNGFVSSGARFDYSDGVATSVSPGPGTYSMATTDMAAPACVGTRSSMFAPPISRVGPPFEPEHSSSEPGPGSYRLVADKPNARDARGGRSAFRCGIKRFEECPEPVSIDSGALNPAPGQYEVLRTFKPSDSGRQNASFRSKTDRLSNTNSNTQKAGPPMVIYSANARTMCTDTSPGPGSYNADRTTSMARGNSRGANDSVKMSSMFRSTTAERFVSGTDLVLAPGPGTYDHRVKGFGLGARSVFVSATKRNTVSAAVRNAPGPAFYMPKQVGRKSFHINNQVNGQHKWV